MHIQSKYMRRKDTYDRRNIHKKMDKNNTNLNIFIYMVFFFIYAYLMEINKRFSNNVFSKNMLIS